MTTVPGCCSTQLVQELPPWPWTTWNSHSEQPEPCEQVIKFPTTKYNLMDRTTLFYFHSLSKAILVTFSVEVSFLASCCLFLLTVPPDFQAAWLSSQALGETATVRAYLRFTILFSAVFWHVSSPVIQPDRRILLPMLHFISRISNLYCKHSNTSNKCIIYTCLCTMALTVPRGETKGIHLSCSNNC